MIVEKKSKILEIWTWIPSTWISKIYLYTNNASSMFFSFIFLILKERKFILKKKYAHYFSKFYFYF